MQLARLGPPCAAGFSLSVFASVAFLANTFSRYSAANTVPNWVVGELRIAPKRKEEKKKKKSHGELLGEAKRLWDRELSSRVRPFSAFTHHHDMQPQVRLAATIESNVPRRPGLFRRVQPKSAIRAAQRTSRKKHSPRLDG